MKLRAITLVHVKYSFHISVKTYFFYFTQLLFQNTHVSLFTLEETSIKYSFFIHFLLFYLMIILFEFKLIFQTNHQNRWLRQRSHWSTGIFAPITIARVVSSMIGLLALVVELIVSIIGPLVLIAKTVSPITGMAVQVTRLQCGKFKYNCHIF